MEKADIPLKISVELLKLSSREIYDDVIYDFPQTFFIFHLNFHNLI